MGSYWRIQCTRQTWLHPTSSCSDHLRTNWGTASSQGLTRCLHRKMNNSGPMTLSSFRADTRKKFDPDSEHWNIFLMFFFFVICVNIVWILCIHSRNFPNKLQAGLNLVTSYFAMQVTSKKTKVVAEMHSTVIKHQIVNIQFISEERLLLLIP